MAPLDPGTSSDHERASWASTSAELYRPGPRCSTCNTQAIADSRNLVVCIDGTSNQFGQNNTNVVKLFAQVDLETRKPHPKQCAYYSSGIGTRPKSLHVIDRIERAFSDKFDMAIAWNMEEIVKDAYGWLARTYLEGDQIYLFGFSRGAYQVRVLAGMIHEIGLIRTPTEKQIGTAYDHYESIRSQKPKTREIAREFKQTFSWKDLRVHFVGVWDTVSSVGLVRGDVFLSTSSSAAHACHFRHALALDERRVKFIPEYFHEMNTHMDDTKSRDPKDSKASEIKEVWFAGSHSDVGGKNRPGKSSQAGNVSLLWMRQEASSSGLVLKPTDIVWMPDDLDFGTSNSMSTAWKLVEILPIRHQVSFSGSGENARRWHLFRPRRIIPGQKIHASILYANAYRPRATWGDGFEVIPPQIQSATTDLPDDRWEKGLFDHTAARVLVGYLIGQQGVAPIYLDRLLFMLRFPEGKDSVRQVPGWKKTFEDLVVKGNGLVRLVALVAYFEASEDEVINFEKDVVDAARQSLNDILTARKHRDCSRVVALLRPLTEHKALRRTMLTPEIVQSFVEFLDKILSERSGNFTQAMDGLACLVECDDLRKNLIDGLGSNSGPETQSRLSSMLEVDDKRHLTAALRVVVLLAQKEPTTCNEVKLRLRKLAKKHKGLVGQLAVEALLAMYSPSDNRQQLSRSLRDPSIRANLASALNRLNIENHQEASSNSNGPAGDEILRHLFGLGADALEEGQKKLIRELMSAVEGGSARERTAATLTLLKLSGDAKIRDYLLQAKAIVIFVNQLQYKKSALLAAYALTVFMEHDKMRPSITQDPHVPHHIVNMLRLDYFDDAVGQNEGFQIFSDLLKDDNLRWRIKEYNITEVFARKLGAGRSSEIRTSLICLDIFRSFEHDGPWTRELVEKGLQHLRSRQWKTQKAGVTILSSLAQTKQGVETLKTRIHEIVEMLLPRGYLPIRQSSPGASSSGNPSQADASPTSRPTPHPSHTIDNMSIIDPRPTSPPSWMLGPACALRVLSANQILREAIRETVQYGSLKLLWLSGSLVDDVETSPWRVKTPTKGEVMRMIDKMVLSVDEGFSKDDVTSVGDSVLPHIQHWDRLVVVVCSSFFGVVTVLPFVLGVSAFTVAAGIALTPVVLSIELVQFVRRLLWFHEQRRIVDDLQTPQPVTGVGSG